MKNLLSRVYVIKGSPKKKIVLFDIQPVVFRRIGLLKKKKKCTNIRLILIKIIEQKFNLKFTPTFLFFVHFIKI